MFPLALIFPVTDNLSVEVAFPIEESRLQRRIISEGLNHHLKDSANSWVLKKHDGYVKSLHQIHKDA